MKRALWAVALALAVTCCCVLASRRADPIPATVEAVAFSPNGGSRLGYGENDCADTVVEAIGHAKISILVQAYNFTSEPIAEALIAACKRGVSVKIIGDKSVPSEHGGKAAECADAGIVILIDHKHHIAHNKVIVIDDQTVITGSFNWTESAEKENAENLLVLHSDKLAAIYTANWNTHAEHSVSAESAKR